MRTLLLADDSVMTQRVIALTFADEPFRVVTVSDGQQARDSMAVMRPDIVLASVTLPRTNGYELAEYIRSIETLRDVPVLLLSGAFELVDQARLKASGAGGIIEKPLEPTAVINRVRELLGLKDTRPAPLAGRLLTSVGTPSDRKAPPAADKPRPAADTVLVSPWDELPAEAAPAPEARSAEGGPAAASRDDYLGTLDAAFDSLDQHLAGRHQEPHSQHRNPSPPLGKAPGSADPRSPGRRPSHSSEGVAANSVFEVDTEWFAEDDRARAERRAHERDLAAEMGVHDVELPEAEPVPSAAAPAEGLDFDFGLDDLPPAEPSKGMDVDAPIAEPEATVTPVAPAPLVPAPTPLSPPDPGAWVPTSVADDFAALLAFETGGALPQSAPAPRAFSAAPVVAPPVLQAVAPEITDAMLDTIAQRVADRLDSGAFGSHLREAMITTVRETVRSVVSETSERLVREEIARVRARAEDDAT